MCLEYVNDNLKEKRQRARTIQEGNKNILSSDLQDTYSFVYIVLPFSSKLDEVRFFI